MVSLAAEDRLVWLISGQLAIIHFADEHAFSSVGVRNVWRHDLRRTPDLGTLKTKGDIFNYPIALRSRRSILHR